MANTKSVLLLYFLLNLLIFAKCQFFDDVVGMKIFSCMNVMDKKYNKEKQPNAYSPPMLTCFMRISPEQLERVINDFGRGTSSLTKEEVDELTNVEYLKRFSESELKKYSAELENYINEFQKFDQDFSKLKESKKLDENFDANDDDDDEKKKKKKVADKNVVYFIFGSLIIFGILIISRLTSDLDKNKENDQENKNNEKPNEKEKENKEKEDKQKEDNKGNKDNKEKEKEKEEPKKSVKPKNE